MLSGRVYLVFRCALVSILSVLFLNIKEFTIAQLLRRELKYSKMTSVQIVIAGMGGTDDMPYIILASWRLGLFQIVKT